MDAIFKMLNAASRLELSAKNGEPDAMREVMRQVASDLMASAQKAAPKWGELIGLIRDLEKGK